MSGYKYSIHFYRLQKNLTRLCWMETPLNMVWSRELDIYIYIQRTFYEVPKQMRWDQLQAYKPRKAAKMTQGHPVVTGRGLMRRHVWSVHVRSNSPTLVTWRSSLNFLGAALRDRRKLFAAKTIADNTRTSMWYDDDVAMTQRILTTLLSCQASSTQCPRCEVGIGA